MNAEKILVGFAIALAGTMAYAVYRLIDHVQTSLSGIL